jgi:hypothetical protein
VVAESPRPSGSRRAPTPVAEQEHGGQNGRASTIVGLIDRSVDDSERTKNLIMIVFSVMVACCAVGVVAAAVLYLAFQASKGTGYTVASLTPGSVLTGTGLTSWAVFGVRKLRNLWKRAKAHSSADVAASQALPGEATPQALPGRATPQPLPGDAAPRPATGTRRQAQQVPKKIPGQQTRPGVGQSQPRKGS